MSISSVAVACWRQRWDPLAQRKAVVVGVGEMGVQALKTLQGRGVEDVVVVNRTVAKAEVLAKRFGYRAAPLSALPELLADADLVLSATGAQAQILTGPLIAAVRRQRGPEPLMLIDVAVPRDIDPDVRALDGVHLLDIDELNTTVDEALESRQEQIPRVNAIIDEETEAFHKTMSELVVEPVIADLRKRAEQIRQAELARTIRFLGEDVDPATLKHIQHLSRALVNKLLHEPTVALKKQATNGHAAEYASTVQDLFGLSEQNGAVR
ncbi:MAG: glutamyl-tRNA reductase [Caldilineaceae bacterium]